MSPNKGNKNKKKHLATRKGLPPKKAVLNKEQENMKSESLPCPALSAVLEHFEPGDYDPDFLFTFSGYVEDSMFLRCGVQRLNLMGPNNKFLVAIINTNHAFDKDTNITVHGWLGLTSTSELSLMVQLLEFDFPSESEPNFIDPSEEPSDSATGEQNPPGASGDQVAAGTATISDTSDECVTKPSSEDVQGRGEGSPDLTPRSVDQPATSQPCGGTVFSGVICDTSDTEIKGAGKLGEGKGTESETFAEYLKSLQDDEMAGYIKDMEITKRINLVHYELLAAKILKRVVSQDLPKGESFLYRNLDEPLRSSIATIVNGCGYDYATFSVLADEITNTRHERAHFNASKSFEDNVNAAKFDFSVYYRVQMQKGGFGKNKEYFQCLSDVFNMYHALKKVFKK